MSDVSMPICTHLPSPVSNPSCLPCRDGEVTASTATPGRWLPPSFLHKEWWPLWRAWRPRELPSSHVLPELLVHVRYTSNVMDLVSLFCQDEDVCFAPARCLQGKKKYLQRMLDAKKMSQLKVRPGALESLTAC